MMRPISIVVVLLVSIVQLHLQVVKCGDDHEALNRVPIRFRQAPRSQVAIRGARVTFRCDYDIDSGVVDSSSSLLSSSRTSVKWLFEDVTATSSAAAALVGLPPKMRYLVDIDQFEFDTNALHILAYEPRVHTGLYRCLVNYTATSPPLVLLSPPANLSLAQIQAASYGAGGVEIVKLDITEGNVAHIPCALPHSNPPAVPQFYLNHQPIPILSSSSSSSRYKVMPSGSLQISNARASDSGMYACTALNELTLSAINSSVSTLLRVYEPSGTSAPAIVHAPLETNRVVRGANLTLECVAQGAPVPLVTWQKFGGGQLPPEGRASQVLGNLVIVDVRDEDRGTYVCRAENGPGLATFKTALVEVFDAPRLVADTDVVVRRGVDRIEVRCPIRGRPRPDVVWFKDGLLVESNKNGYRMTTMGDKSVLVIDSYQLANGASIYQCFARNEYGWNQADIYVNPSAILSPMSDSLASQNQRLNANINNKRPQIILGPQNTTIYEGQTVVLLCVTSTASSTAASAAAGSASSSSSSGESLTSAAPSQSNTQINWLQNDLIIEPTLMRRFEINQLLGNLRIVSVQKSDAGVYKCIASNEYGMSTAEAYVTVKSVGGDASSSNSKNNEDTKQRKQSHQQQNKPQQQQQQQSSTPQSSRPVVQQIGDDKILLRWHLVDPRSGANIDNSATAPTTSYPAVAYFKVDYKTNAKQQQQQSQQQQQQLHTWLTIDEQIDAKKREYILTDLSRAETYRFRITTFFVNGELNHSYQSARFRLDPTWMPPMMPSQTTTTAATAVTSTNNSNKAGGGDEIKLADIQVQISQIWAISTSSLGLKWDIYTTALSSQININKTSDLAKKINGFYIYYRKTDTTINSGIGSDNSGLIYDMVSSSSSNSNPIPIYNYTRINIPISQVEKSGGSSSDDDVIIQHALIDTYIIANLAAATQYEIKMTCYNLNGDLCSFSPPIYGLTLADTAAVGQPSSLNRTHHHLHQQPVVSTPAAASSSKQHEILFMILGIVLGALTLLLVLFVVMCVARHRQHARLLAQLHNTSHKLTSSSCPTLIYEDSLRQQALAAAANQLHLRQLLMAQQQQQQQQQQQYASAKLIDTNLSLVQSGIGGSGGCVTTGSGSGGIGLATTSSASGSGNDSNSTNSQSMSTTTSSMTTPPALNSADHQQHMFGDATVNSSKPPPIPQHPPPTVNANRININLNPLNSYLDQHQQAAALSPSKGGGNETNNQPQQQPSENFYHTLTTLGTLPNEAALPPYDITVSSAAAAAAAAAAATDYTNTTLNIHRLQLLKQQQQQQQFIMNTLKTLNYRNKQFIQQQQNAADQQQQQQQQHARSPSVGSMKRQSSVSSSKRSKKGAKKDNSNSNSNNNNNNNADTTPFDIQHHPQQQQTNYYLLPNSLRPSQANAGSANLINPILAANRNIYNEMELLTLEAALNTQPNLTNLLLLNHHHPATTSTFMAPPPPPMPPHHHHAHHHHHLLMTTQAGGEPSSLLYPTSNCILDAAAVMMSPLRNPLQPQPQPQLSHHHHHNHTAEATQSHEYEVGGGGDKAANNSGGEDEPMLASHYASSGIIQHHHHHHMDNHNSNNSNNNDDNKADENRKLI